MRRVCFGVLRALAMAGAGAAIGPIWAGVLGSGPPTPAPELFDTLPEVPESSGPYRNAAKFLALALRDRWRGTDADGEAHDVVKVGPVQAYRIADRM